MLSLYCAFIRTINKISCIHYVHSRTFIEQHKISPVESVGGKQWSVILVRVSLVGTGFTGGFQLCVVHRLDLSLELLHHSREGMRIHPVLTQPDAYAQGGWIEIRVE